MSASVPYIVTMERRITYRVRVFAAHADDAMRLAGYRADEQTQTMLDEPTFTKPTAISAEAE